MRWDWRAFGRQGGVDGAQHGRRSIWLAAAQLGNSSMHRLAWHRRNHAFRNGCWIKHFDTDPGDLGRRMPSRSRKNITFLCMTRHHQAPASFVNVLEGSHCGFADAGSLCDLGELLFSGMSRDEFQGHAFEMALLWLRAHLMEDASALNEMEAYGLAQSAVEVSLTCVLSEVPMLCESLKVWPNPAQETLFLSGLSPGDVLMAYDMHGRRLAVDWMGRRNNIARWPRGMVVIQPVKEW